MKIVVLFDSIHDVLAAERVLLAAKLWHDLIPTPREFSSDCGMAVALDAGDRRAFETLPSDPPLRYRRIVELPE